MQDLEQTPRNGDGYYSRRIFLKGSGAAVAATAAIGAASTEALGAEPAKPNVISAKATDLTLNVNGKDYKVKVEPRVTLLDCLRDDLNFTAAKEVEDTAAIGADTVLLDGKPVLAGTVLAHECAGKKVVTAESLCSGGKCDEVITGFVKHDGLQCGYCTPGFVMATRAALDKKPNATADDIKHMLGGNLCRCGTYHGILQCALEIAKKGGA